MLRPSRHHHPRGWACEELVRCKNWFPTLWWVNGTNVLVASFFHQRLFLLFFLSPVKCYKYHPLRRYQLFWRQEQTTVEKKTSLRADQLIKNANMCKLILPSWNSNEPCFFSMGKTWKNIEKITIYNMYLYIYIAKQISRLTRQIHWESTLDSEDPVSSRPIMYVGDFSTGSPAIFCRERLESERGFKSRLQNVAKRRPNGMDTKWDYFRWICRMLMNESNVGEIYV